MALRTPAPGGSRRTLVVTGGPAVGKSATGRALASARPRAAFIEVDDVRRQVVAGGEPPWRGQEGRAQHALGVLNAGCMARHFTDAGFEVVIADVLTPSTADLLRHELSRCVIVHLVAAFDEVTRRASARPAWITDDELRLLHDNDRTSPPPADHRLDVTSMSLREQISAVEEIWARA